MSSNEGLGKPARLAPMLIDSLREIVALKHEVAAYRQLLQVALAALAKLTTDHERQREKYYALLDAQRSERRAA
ncbi:MAG TPA: hypothetical protein VNJ04_07625 [Gemmatimonadaceae bacterium]|nr:hypothetical protein [Gemmatimonadaceae bacterium]